MRNLVLSLFFLFFHSPLPLFAIEFFSNGFDPSDFLLLGDSTFQPLFPGGTRYLSATNSSRFSAGRAFHKSKITTRRTNTSTSGPTNSSINAVALPFHASFLFSIAQIPGVLPGHGITFLFSPLAELEPGTQAQQLGLFNFTTNDDASNGVFAIEFDVFKNAEFNDIDNNHVGVDVYSLTSVESNPAGYWKDESFVKLTLNDGTNYQAWVDYSNAHLNVTMAVAGTLKPSRPLISVDLDLAPVFKDEMYIGFSASTGRLVENHRILGWSFSNTNSSLSKELITSGLPNFATKDEKSGAKALIAGITSALAVLVILGAVVGLLLFQRRRRRRRNWRKRDQMEWDDGGEAEDWELEYWPHRIGYKKILSATNGFSDENLIGVGGNGRVYKGSLAGAPVAVKLFSRNAGEEAKGFLAEVSTLGRLKHRNLVGLPGHGITFLFSPLAELEPGTQAQQLGLFNFTTNDDSSNGVFAIEFDVFQNAEFNDINNNHAGVDVYSLTSVESNPAGYWKDESFVKLTLNDGTNYQAWVDYSDAHLNITIAVADTPKPSRPLISVDLDLALVFKDEMYIGFSASTGRLVENHWILGWSFSNTNSSFSKELITSGLPNFATKDKKSRAKVLIAGITSALAVLVILGAVIVLLLFQRRRRRRRNWTKRDQVEWDDGGQEEDWELEYWPHRIGYKEILSATNGLSDENLIGAGGNGRIYKGSLAGAPVAVKLFSRIAGEEEKGFLAEVSTLGRLKHRNLVGLKGWCRKQGGDFILVYEYMENGSLDKRIFSEETNNDHLPPLDWSARVRILKDVAAGVLYLHDGWESKVLHRDIKSSNVMLDMDMVGRLGDFGLARMHPHGGASRTTKVVGTVGYMAPEVVRSGKSTAATDVYAFGVLVLEVVFGRRPVVEGAPELIEFAWEVEAKGEVATAVDERVKGSDRFDNEEAEWMMRLGLLCTCTEAGTRPTMRQVVRVLDGGRVEDGLEERGAEAYSIEKLKTAMMAKRLSAATWSVGQQDFTFPEFQQLMSSSAELSTSDLI